MLRTEARRTDVFSSLVILWTERRRVGPARRVLGFYTLSATSIQLTEVPAALAKKLPRYPRLPATLLGRLATDLSARGVGLGRFLLIDAITRAVRSEWD